MQENTLENKSSIGSIIGIIIIIAVIILGGLYFWGKRIEEAKSKEALVSDTTAINNEYNEAAVIKSVSSTDDLNSIESDLNATNLNNLSAETNS
ncbi:hypothetical protein H0W91_03120 [Patescibacteria group bacterium]|nr:hypothetical protein [Patescibacteria group bacterium]